MRYNLVNISYIMAVQYGFFGAFYENPKIQPKLKYTQNLTPNLKKLDLVSVWIIYISFSAQPATVESYGTILFMNNRDIYEDIIN